jgi:YD repeat-containing protein
MKVLYKLIAIGCVLWGIVTGFARADGTLPSYYQDPGLNPNRSTVNHNLDEHIDPFTGMLQLHHIDGTLPGNGGFDLVLQRSFNSPGPVFGTTSDTMSYNRTPNIGVGWNLLIGGRALYVPEACSGSFHQFSFETPDGGRQGLHATGNGDFLSPSRWRAVCITGGVRVFAPNGTRYEMTQVIAEAIPNTIGGATFYYPTQIVDRNGNSATFTYGTVGTYTVVSNISTSDGRSMDFAYGTLPPSQTLLLGTVSTGARTWTFHYYLTPALTDVGGNGVAYFLSGVSPPAGADWSYQYVLAGQIGAYSIARFWYPEGGSVAYTYGQVNFNDGSGNTTVVATKQTGNYTGIAGPASNTWQYTYAPGSLGRNDVTTVTSALGTTTYEHVGAATVGAGSTWQVGLLMKKTQTDLNLSDVQVETNTWDKQQISPFPTYRQFGLNDGVTYAPIMTQHAVTRYGGTLSGGTTYTTSNSNFDTYGNAQTIVETGQRSHTTTRAYYIDTAKWILHTPANESTTGIGSILRTFDANGNLWSENRYGVSTSYTYLSDGSLGSRTDANGKATMYSLYYRGVPRVEQRPEAVTINRGVDGAGNVLSQTDGAGNTYGYSYDALRRLIGKTPPIGAPTVVTWTSNSYRTATRGTYVETTTLDGLANPYLAARSGIRSAFAYDALSRKLFESLPGQVTDNPGGGVHAVGTQLARDIIGRVTKATNSDGSYRSYSDASYAIAETDEDGHAKTYHYVAFGDPDKRFLTGIDLPKGNNIAVGRDDLGNITSVTQGGVTRTYHYNGSYFLTSIDDPETGTTTFGRDAVGNMKSRTVGGTTTIFTYDGLNRLTNISYPASGSVTITYFGNGRTASVTNNQAARTYTYDGNANLKSETLTVGGQTFTTTYTYNANDALATTTYPKTGAVVSYSPDALGRATKASPFITAVSYFDSGNAKQITYASNIQMDFTENARQWPSSITAALNYGGLPAFLSKAYGYYNNGNVSFINDNVEPRQSLVMSYDTNDQLTGAWGPWGSQATMTYDPVGNLTSFTGSAARNYSYDATNKLSSVTGGTFTYDSYGNVTSDGSHTYRYDDASNLTCVDCGTGNEIDYAYDGNNRRVSRTKGGVTTYFVHASNGDLLLEYTPSTNATLEHFYLNGKRIATRKLP